MKCETYILQNKRELYEFAKLLHKENVRSYLEIGCKFGGSIWHIGNQLAAGTRIVGVDLPQGDRSFKDTQPHLEECFEKLKKVCDAHLILGDSTDPKIIEKVYELGPYDAVFIDANHTLPYIKKDWANYGKIARIVAFHDISFYRNPDQMIGKKPIEVPGFWKQIKDKYRHIEIRYDKQDNGIGVLWV
jgi:Methyltransferase domain